MTMFWNLVRLAMIQLWFAKISCVRSFKHIRRFLLNVSKAKQMNSTNSTISPRLLWYDSTASTLVFITPIVNLIISTTCLIVLNTYLKKLHRTFKIMLNIILIHNTVLEIGQVSFNVIPKTFSLAPFEHPFLHFSSSWQFTSLLWCPF